jgi:hypothetical protein
LKNSAKRKIEMGRGSWKWKGVKEVLVIS